MKTLLNELIRLSNVTHQGIVFGVLIATLSVITDSVKDLSVKHLIALYPAQQLIFIRVFGDLFVAVAVACIERNYRLLLPSRLCLHVLRAGFVMITMTLLYQSFARLPLAEATALFMLAPVVIAVLAALMLQESFTLINLLAVVIGFIGAVIVVDPVFKQFNWIHLLPLLATISYALVNILSRMLSRTDHNAAISFNGSIIILAVLLCVKPGSWISPSPGDLFFLSILMIGGGISSYLIIYACRVAPLAFIAPVEYMLLVLAAGWGFILWGEIPSARTWLGGVCIIVAAMCTTIAAWRFEE